ncbi:MAG: hypothetical protein EBS55_03055 [Flavobacteriaceae bacterium]|nr:hypothetical protein [Flavobacteriaceae bacterium]
MIKLKHSGNAGDILYSLPAIRQATINKVEKAILYLKLNTPANYMKGFVHPLGNVMLNEYMFKMLRPLLLTTDFIEDVIVYNGQKIDYDLDKFREIGLNLGAGNISRWYFQTFPELTCDLFEPTLGLGFSKLVKNDSIIINRTERYQNGQLDYSILNQYDNHKYFVGTEHEYYLMSKIIKDLEYVEAFSFYHIAELINNCKVFIGNQSMNFAIAEQLKSNRILEMYFGCPNVIPCGGKAYDVFNQEGFEYALNQFLK